MAAFKGQELLGLRGSSEQNLSVAKTDHFILPPMRDEFRNSQTEYALPPLMSPRDFEEFVVGFDKPLVDLVHSYPGTRAVIHSHGRVNAFLERFAAIGIDGLNVLEPPPQGDTVLVDAKRRVGDQLCLIGNIQYDDIVRGTSEGVERLVREAIRDGSPGGGFILSPCASPYESPLSPKGSDNLITYLVKADEFGRQSS